MKRSTLIRLGCWVLFSSLSQASEPGTDAHVPARIRTAAEEIRELGGSVTFCRSGTAVRVTFPHGTRHTRRMDRNLACLLDLPNIEELTLEGMHIADDGCRILSKLTSLRKLSLYDSRMTDPSLGFLGHLTRLEELNVAENPNITDDSAKAIAALRTLRVLDLTNTSISDEGICHLVNLANLETLALRDTDITERALVDIRKLQKLRSLDLRRNIINYEALAELGKLPQLTTLDVRGIVSWDEPDVEALRKALPRTHIIDSKRTYFFVWPYLAGQP